MADVLYRLRIRNAADSADELAITSVRGGTNPYALKPPQGDGQSFDPLTGEVTTGAYTFQIVDAEVSANNRVLTGVLADANARQQLLSRKAFVETSADGVAWSILVPGYVNAVRLPSAIVGEIQVGQTRRVEMTRMLFRGGSANFDKFTGIMGAAVRGGWGPIKDQGGWLVRVDAIDSTNGVVRMKLVDGFDPRRDGKRFGSSFRGHVIREIWSLTNPHANWKSTPQLVAAGIKAWFPTLAYRIQNRDGSLKATTIPLSSGSGALQSLGVPEFAITGNPFAIFPMLWSPGVGELAVGELYDLFLFATEASNENPLHVHAHPVDIVEQIWLESGEAYDAAALPALRELLGADRKLLLRITAPVKQGEFLRRVIFGPFGLATRIDSQGRLVLFSTRIKSSATPAKVIALADLANANSTIFDLDESTVANRITIKTERFDLAVTPDTEQAPADGVVITPVTVSVENGDTAVYGDSETVYEIPGTITQGGSAAGVDLEQFATGVAREVFDRYGRGAIAGELNCLATVDLVLGEEVQLDLPHQVNAVAGRTPVAQRGGIRIVQVVRRTETPHGPTLKVIDSGTTAQAATPPTISIAAGADARKMAVVTITNAATLAAAGLLVRLEMGTGAVAPATGALLTIADPATTVTVAIPPADAGTRVWVRARSEKTGLRPSAWSAWANVQLTTLNAVTGLTVSAEDAADRSRRTLIWAVGANAGDIPVEVLSRLSAWGEWANRVVAVLPAGSTQYELRDLTAATRVVTVRHRESSPFAGTSADTTTNVITAAGQRTLAAPTDPSAFAGSLSPDGTTVLDGTYGIEVTAQEFPSGVEVQVAVGAGAFEAAGTINSVQGGRTRWTGFAPNDGFTRSIRARHTQEGADPSAWTATVTVNPWNAKKPAETGGRPAAPLVFIVPVIGSRSQTSETLRVSGEIGRGGLEPLEYRYRIDDGAWSAYAALGVSGSTVDIAVTKAKFYDKGFQAQVRDARPIESDVATWTVIGEYEGTATGTGRLKPTVPMDITGWLPFGRGGDTAFDVVELSTHRFTHGNMLDASRNVVNVYRTAVNESVGNLFKRGSDTATDVLTTGARAYVDPALVDPSFRVTAVYRSGMNEPVNNLVKAGDALTDAQLSSNIARLNTAQTWTARQTLSAGEDPLHLRAVSALAAIYMRFLNSAYALRGYVGFPSYGGGTFHIYNAEGDSNLYAGGGLQLTALAAGGGTLYGAWTTTDTMSASDYYNTTGAWYRSTGNAGWYNSTYAVGIYATAAGQVRTYNSSGLYSEAYLQAATFVRAGNYFYADQNYGSGMVGLYSPARYQLIYAMGDAYKLPIAGTTVANAGNTYALIWTYDTTDSTNLPGMNVTGQSCTYGFGLVTGDVWRCYFGHTGAWFNTQTTFASSVTFSGHTYAASGVVHYLNTSETQYIRALQASYGSVTIGGVGTSGYAGFHFASTGQVLMAAASILGYYDGSVGWHWYISTDGYDPTYATFLYTRRRYLDHRGAENVTSGAIRLRRGSDGGVRGWLYFDTSGFGLLNEQGGWSVLAYYGASYGGELRGNWSASGNFSAGQITASGYVVGASLTISGATATVNGYTVARVRVGTSATPPTLGVGEIYCQV